MLIKSSGRFVEIISTWTPVLHVSAFWRIVTAQLLVFPFLPITFSGLGFCFWYWDIRMIINWGFLDLSVGSTKGGVFSTYSPCYCMEKLAIGSLLPLWFSSLLTPLSLHSSFMLQNIFKVQISLQEISPIKFSLIPDVFPSSKAFPRPWRWQMTWP